MGSVVFTIAVTAPWVAVVVAALLPASTGTVARAAAWVTGTGAVAAVATGLLAVLGERPPSGGLWAGDPVAVLMLMLVLWLSAVIQVFAVRYLRGDLRQRWFAVWANALTGSTVVMVCAGTVVTFTVGWIAAGLCLVFLLNTYRSLPQARQGVRRAGLSFLIADAPLVVAVLILTLAVGGDVRLAQVGSVAGILPEGMVVAVALLLVVAALGRSAQFPFHRWLPSTLAAPTPVSALLHAGVVNAGAILVIRFSPLIAPVAVAMLVIFAAGAATLVYAAAVRLVKPDVKGRLVFSTAGQMGFMMMAVGLGAFAAAVFHLLAHALYKSALFLSAGTGVARHAEQRTWPAPEPSSRSRTVAAALLATTLTVAVLVAAKVVLAPQATPASLALLGFVAFTAVVAIAAGLRRTMTTATLTAAGIGLTVLGFFYVAFLGLFDSLISPAASMQPASPWLLLIPAALLLGLQWLARSPRTAGGMHRVLYMWALAESTVSPPTRIEPVRARQKEVVA
ncbi:NAD(P)H-quinone oxidoreductase subunit 5 [Promicromonospora umidemergens]|nr:sodium:proton antiporter [Actinomycetota bacterium]MCP2286965.1 NAD(P)H-quinone oxidoreductase subunit 5 [Promicromonospora umidemergens]